MLVPWFWMFPRVYRRVNFAKLEMLTEEDVVATFKRSRRQ